MARMEGWPSRGTPLPPGHLSKPTAGWALPRKADGKTSDSYRDSHEALSKLNIYSESCPGAVACETGRPAGPSWELILYQPKLWGELTSLLQGPDGRRRWEPQSRLLVSPFT